VLSLSATPHTWDRKSCFRPLHFHISGNMAQISLRFYIIGELVFKTFTRNKAEKELYAECGIL
jgi:hypothetical protein